MLAPPCHGRLGEKNALCYGMRRIYNQIVT
jgi:hypothetical protein